MKSPLSMLLFAVAALPIHALCAGKPVQAEHDSVQAFSHAAEDYPKGLSLGLDGGVPFPQASEAGGTFFVNLGLRYTISTPLSVGLKFATGDERYPPGAILYAMGGASAGLESRLHIGSLLYPGVSAYYDWLTLLNNGSGYDGHGFTLSGGAEILHPDRYFSFRLALTYRHREYTPYPGSVVPPLRGDEPAQDAFGVSLSAYIHFHLGL